MPRTAFLRAALAATMLAAAAPPGAAQGQITGGEKYDIPAWFKQSFLEIADDAAEAAEADRHAVLFIHSPE